MREGTVIGHAIACAVLAAASATGESEGDGRPAPKAPEVGEAPSDCGGCGGGPCCGRESGTPDCAGCPPECCAVSARQEKPPARRTAAAELTGDDAFAGEVERALHGMRLDRLLEIEKGLGKPESADDLARRALVQFALARYHEAKEDKKGKVRHAKLALKAMLGLAKRRPSDVQPWAYASDAAAILADSGGAIAGMRYGPKVGRFAGKAVELDPEGLRARILLLDRYGRAPEVGGGDLQRALEETEKLFAEVSGDAAADGPSRREVEYRLFYIYLKLGMKEKADAVEKSLLERHPEDKYLRELMELDRRRL